MFRNKLWIDEEGITQTYIEEGILILGRYRHGRLTNYDNLVKKINEKWINRNHGLSQEIIHSLSNKLNDQIIVALAKGIERKCCNCNCKKKNKAIIKKKKNNSSRENGRIH